MTIERPPVDPVLEYPSFRAWQRETLECGLGHVIGFAGTRGKSTVLRMVEATLCQAHLRCATWTDVGVEVNGRPQRGELSGWRNALIRLAEGQIDVALQELDWLTVNAVGLPTGSYPALVISSLRDEADHGNRGASFNYALNAVRRCADAVASSGFIVFNADDHFVYSAVQDTVSSTIAVSLSEQAPNLRRHLADGGTAVWVRNGDIVIGDQHTQDIFAQVRDFPITMQGEAQFHITNLLLAIALSRALGLDLPTIRAALLTFRARWELLPGSMNVYDEHEYRVVIDKIAPAWVLRPVLRALNTNAERRQLTVIGDLTWVDLEDVYDLGRLLGRFHGAILLHGEHPEEYLDEFRRGITANPYPSLLIQRGSEEDAIERAFDRVSVGNLILVLTSGDSELAHTVIRRHIAKS